MKYSKSTLYALYAALEMASREGPVTAAEVAERYGIPPGALARVFQMLVRDGIANGVRGVGGGYVLTRPSAEITVLDVVSVFDRVGGGADFLLGERGEAARTQAADGKLERLFGEVSELVRCTFASVSLETLAS